MRFDKSTPNLLQSASSEFWAPGNLFLAMKSESMTTSSGIFGAPIWSSSKLRNLMSNAALWAISLASLMKSRKSLATWAKIGLSERNSLDRPWTLKAASGMSRRGLT